LYRKKNVTGTVRYVGPTHFEKGVWFGVELDEPAGKNNGSVKKQFYFQSNANCGIFVHHKRLIPLKDPNADKNKHVDSNENKDINIDNQENKDINIDNQENKDKSSDNEEKKRQKHW